MEYKEQDKVDVRVSCSKCGLAMDDNQHCSQCSSQTTIAPDESKQIIEPVTLPPASSDEAPASSNEGKKAKSGIGSGVFFRSRLLLAITTVVILTSGVVFALVGEELPFLWTMATRFADSEKDPDRIVQKIVDSASPHNRPFFLMFGAVVHNSRANEPSSGNKSEQQRALAQRQCREAGVVWRLLDTASGSGKSTSSIGICLS